MNHFYQILVVLISLTTLFSQGFEDNQIWHAEKFQKKINENNSISLEQDFRAGENMSTLLYFHADFGIKHKLNNKISLSINFREVFEKKEDAFVGEHRPHGTVSTKTEIGLFDISARSRLEYRMKSGKDPALRNRDMVSIKLRRELTSFKLVPYVANEVFFDIENSEFNRNRFYVGATIGSIKIMKPMIYFMVQSGFKSGTSSHIGILGFKFVF